MHIKIFILGVIVASTVGCGSFFYDAAQTDARNQCKERYTREQEITCLEQHERTFDEYHEERKKVLETK